MTGQILVILGPQGSGKGTQAELLAKRLDIPLVVAGDLFRAESVKGTSLGRSVKALLEKGEIQTIANWEQVVGNYLADADVSRGLLFDSLLRSMEQVASFDRILTTRHFNQPTIINLQVPTEVSVTRLLGRGRSDDTEPLIRRRLEWSATDMQPVISHYRAQGQVLDINGDQTVEQVQAEIVAKLKERGLFVTKLGKSKGQSSNDK